MANNVAIKKSASFILPVILASLVSGVFIYFSVPLQNIQILVILAICLVMLLLNGFFHLVSRIVWLNLVPHNLFVVTLITQLLILSTGGFFSPFLIFLHLSSLGISFLASRNSALFFLASGILLLVANLYVDKENQINFLSDPWTVILYALSFLVILPISQKVADTYYLKSRVLKAFQNRQRWLKSFEEEFIKDLPEPVFITDNKFNIIFANQSAIKLANLNSGGNAHLFDLLTPVDRQTLNEGIKKTSGKSYHLENIQFRLKSGEVITKDLKVNEIIGVNKDDKQFVIVIDK